MNIEPTSLVGLAKKTDLVTHAQGVLRKVRDKLIPVLEQALGEKQARLELVVYTDLIIRGLMAKPLPAKFRGVHAGAKGPHASKPLSDEKVKDLGIAWGRYLEEKYPDRGLAEALDLSPPSKSSESDESQPVALDNLTDRDNLRGPHEGSSGEFKRGDLVTVVRRMSWPMPQSGNPEYRKDIVVGASGTVEGYADPEHRQVLMKIHFEHPPDGPQSFVYPVTTRNIKLTSAPGQEAEAEAEAGAEEGQAPSATASGASDKKIPSWLLGDSEPSAVKVEKGWSKLLADSDTLNRNFWLKGRISVCLEALANSIPKFGPEDLVVVHRQNEKGVWRDELWTKRHFAANELILAPLTPQVKDTHLTACAHAPVGIPRVGKGSHPEGASLALDGRLRNLIAHAGSIDANQHTGTLFWLVGRTQDASEANVHLESITYGHHIEVHLPLKKRKVSKVDWHPADLPTIPVIINKKPLAEHTQLLVLQKHK